MGKPDYPLDSRPRNNRMVDLVVLLALIATGSYLFRQTRAEPPAPTPAPAALASPGSRMAPAFELPQLDGKPFRYAGGRGPALITLSAVGCGGCRDRASAVDREAYQLAKSRGIPVWNMFVYATPQAGQAFKDELKPQADEFLADPDGTVAVGRYGGSDESCWILIGPAGDIVWQGGSDLKALEQAWSTFPVP